MYQKIKKIFTFYCNIISELLFYESYTIYQALNLIKDQQIIYEKEGPVEETK